jgi:hypothetical protein
MKIFIGYNFMIKTYICAFTKLKGSNFTATSYREQVTYQWDNEEICFVLDQHAKLDFYSASSLKQQSVNIGHSSQTYYADFKPNSFCSYSLMLHAQHKNNEYQLKSLVWPDQGSNSQSTTLVVRDSSAAQRLFSFFARAVGRHMALAKKKRKAVGQQRNLGLPHLRRVP